MVVTAKAKYDDHTIEEALWEVARCTGNYSRASRQLAERGIKVSHNTIRDWVNRHPRRYAEIRDEAQHMTRQMLAAAHEDVAAKAAEKVREGLDDVDVRDLPERDRPGALRNLETVAGIAQDKAQVTRAQPTEIQQHRHVHEIFARLEARFPGIVVDSTAEEDEVPQLDEGSEKPHIDIPMRKPNRRALADRHTDERRRHPESGGTAT
jgi:hypothetical protein